MSHPPAEDLARCAPRAPVDGGSLSHRARPRVLPETDPNGTTVRPPPDSALGHAHLPHRGSVKHQPRHHINVVGPVWIEPTTRGQKIAGVGSGVVHPHTEPLVRAKGRRWRTPPNDDERCALAHKLAPRHSEGPFCTRHAHRESSGDGPEQPSPLPAGLVIPPLASRLVEVHVGHRHHVPRVRVPDRVRRR